MRDPRFAEAKAWEQHNRAPPEEIAEARASGRAIAEGAVDTTLLRKAEDTADHRRAGFWQALHDEFVAAACEQEARRAAWASELLGAFEVARKSFSTTFADKRDGRELEAASRDWQERKNPFSVWSSHEPHLSVERGDLWFLGRTLLRIAPGEALRAIDSLPYPGLMGEILHLFCREDRALIETLIQAAPPVLDDQGGWIPERSVAALLVAELVTEHAEALHGAVSSPMRAHDDPVRRAAAQRALDGLENHELPEWMRHAFRLVLQRPDGQRIALGYLAHLSRERLLGWRRTHVVKEQWRAGDASIAALAAELRRSSVGVAQAHDAWAAGEKLASAAAEDATKRKSVRPRSARARTNLDGEGARLLRAEGMPLLHGTALVLGDAANSSATNLELFWSWLEELLIGRDPGLSLIHHGTSITDVPRQFGFLLSRLSEPDALLRTTYGKLEPQRRRALFAYRYEEIYSDLESVFLLRVGLNAAANWLDRVKDGSQAKAARELFFWIHDAARRLWLTAVMDTGQTKQQLVIASYAFMPFLFGEHLGAALKRVVPPIANDARMLTELCAILRLNRVKVEEVRRLSAEAGADLPTALRDVHQWSQLTGREEDFPAHLQKLASELGLSLGASESK